MKIEKLTKAKFLPVLWLLAIVCLVVVFSNESDKSEDYLHTDIYDETADGANQVTDALVLAQEKHKLILLQFGANWCVWCHVLYHLLDTDKAVHKELQADYVLVLIDVNNGHNDQTIEKYGNPTQFGLPVLVVLDSTGKQLTTQSVTNFAVGNEYDASRVVRFLRHWATPSLN